MSDPSPSPRVVLGYWLSGLTWLAVVGFLTWVSCEGAGWIGIATVAGTLAALGWLAFLFWLLNE